MCEIDDDYVIKTFDVLEGNTLYTQEVSRSAKNQTNVNIPVFSWVNYSFTPSSIKKLSVRGYMKRIRNTTLNKTILCAF